MIATRKSRHDHVISINPKVVRNINRALILNMIRERQPISRAKIAILSRLNKSTVSSIVGSLLAEDLIVEEADSKPTVGRTPINLRLKTGNHFIGVIYFDSAATHLAIVDIDGTVKQSIEIKNNSGPPPTFIARCVDELGALRKRSHLPEFKGIGVTVAGVVDASHARVVFAPNLGWEEIDLGTIIRDQCPDVPVVAIENDAKASALAELWFGKHDLPLFNFVFLSVGRGIGTGIVVDDRVLEGGAHAAGEFGHMTIVEGGEPCSCGNRGCWEVYASDRSTVQRYLKARGANGQSQEQTPIESVISATDLGDPLAREALLKTGHYLGLGIANIIKAVDPEAIVVGGAVTRSWNLIYPEIMDTVTKGTFFGKQRSTTILPSSLRASAPLLGAAALAIRQIFTHFRVAV